MPTRGMGHFPGSAPPATLASMVHALRAHVKNGRLVLDEPVDLPDGTVVDLVPADEADDLDEGECARQAAVIATSRAEVGRGEGRPAVEVLARLREATTPRS